MRLKLVTTHDPDVRLRLDDGYANPNFPQLTTPPGHCSLRLDDSSGAEHSAVQGELNASEALALGRTLITWAKRQLYRDELHGERDNPLEQLERAFAALNEKTSAVLRSLSDKEHSILRQRLGDKVVDEALGKAAVGVTKMSSEKPEEGGDGEADEG